MSWDDYRVLLAFARAGSLGLAARALEVDKATVSRRLTALEEQLGTLLVDRNRRGWSLTSEGRAIANAAEAMEQAVHAAEELVAGDDVRGPVRVTAPVWFSRELLLPRVTDFCDEHPGVLLEILATNAVLDLADREADVGVRNLTGPDASAVAKKLGMLGSALYAAPAYLERAGTPTDRHALAGHAFVAYHDAVTYCPSLKFLDGDATTIAFRASDTEVLLDAVRAGIGLAIVPCFIGDRDPDVKRVVPDVYSRDAIYACFPETLRSMHRIRCVVDWLASVWQSEAAALAGTPAEEG